ncbi:MAG: DUF4976 domain-containing protein [Cyclobacteriaceae bacterium]|nr:DUF4976 domain-containing protein [Cyclobacteriaceae bacterium]
MGYDATRTERYKLIKYRDLEGMDELYDLEKDPYELNNVISSSELETVRRSLAELLAQAIRR